MQKVVHRAEDRGVAEHGWLHSRFSFSFADWYEETRMGFGALRVINDDTVDPSSGFGMHPHRDMEIVTIVMEGAVTHQDSMGNSGVVRAGEVQVMSAGAGVVHSEMNQSTTDPLKLFQIWIFPNELNVEPRYAQRSFPEPTKDVAQLVVGPWDSGAPLTFHQDARITRLKASAKYTYTLMSAAHGVYVLVIDGRAVVAGEALGPRDAVGVWKVDAVEIVPEKEADVLLIEVPVE